ncbi:MAG: LuxR C-terminal-related transcriptional regulator [Actinomycetota bacterium]
MNGEPSWDISLTAADVEEFTGDARCAVSSLVVVDLSADESHHPDGGLGLASEMSEALALLADRAYPVVAIVSGPVDLWRAALGDLAAAVVGEHAEPVQVRSMIAEVYAGTKEVSAFCTSRLTQPELEVLMLLGTGARNRDIGSRLHISVSTVKRRIESLMTKSGRRTRSGLAALASEVGAVRPETLTVLGPDGVRRFAERTMLQAAS